MLKPGVWKRANFLAAPPSGTLARLLRRLSHTRVSLQLLALPDNPSPEDVILFEKLMPHVRLSSGVYRTTYRQRFRALNPIVNHVLRQRFSGVPGSACRRLGGFGLPDFGGMGNGAFRPFSSP